jgi:hypothetical protein
MTDDDWAFVRRFPDKCCWDVSRKGVSQPCDMVAVAVIVDAEDSSWWPVCAYHTRVGQMVPLAQLLSGVKA